jgi:hypothetical protein
VQLVDNAMGEIELGVRVQEPTTADGYVELNMLLDAMTLDQRERVEGLDREIMQLMDSLGGSKMKYARERRVAVKKLVSEIYSPPRVTAAAKLLPSLDCVPGFAMDLTTLDEHGNPWDFDVPEQRRRARHRIEQDKPMLLVGSPMCTAFSAWQRINNRKRDPTIVSREYIRAMIHIRFTMELYQLQHAAGRYFLHEHPAQASSWAEPVVERIAKMEGVRVVVGDQCQFGAVDAAGGPIKKPTKFMTNCGGVADYLSRRCQGRGGACSRPDGGRHVLCNGKTARMAAIYPFDLCQAILVGFKNQMELDGRKSPGEVGLHALEIAEDAMLHIGGPHGELLKLRVENAAEFRDDLTGQLLDPVLVREARAKEMEYVRSKGLWAKRPVRECLDRTGRPPVTVRWVDTNKGDDNCPNIRSRLVARQIRGPGQEAVFAPTPALEALRTALSLAATDLPGRPSRCRDPKSEKRVQVSFVDISRDYFCKD